MNNPDKPRLLVAGILCEPTISKYLYKLRQECPEVFRHCVNVGYLVAEICYMSLENGLCFKVTKDEVDDVVRGALLHDIGKLKVPHELLLKKDPLTEEEIEILKSHPQVGFDLVKDEPLSDTTKNIILSHHEKLDGSGYPNHIKKISSDIQIVSFCDMYDALTENRSYRSKKSIFTAYQILNEEKLDPELFLMLTTCINR